MTDFELNLVLSEKTILLYEAIFGNDQQERAVVSVPGNRKKLNLLLTERLNEGRVGVSCLEKQIFVLCFADRNLVVCDYSKLSKKDPVGVTKCGFEILMMDESKMKLGCNLSPFTRSVESLNFGVKNTVNIEDIALAMVKSDKRHMVISEENIAKKLEKLFAEALKIPNVKVPVADGSTGLFKADGKLNANVVGPLILEAILAYEVGKN